MKVLKCVHVHTLLKGDGLFQVLFGILLQDRKGNPKPELEWPSENYWKIKFPHLFPDSSPESAHEQEQVSHHSPIFVKVYLLILVRLSVFV